MTGFVPCSVPGCEDKTSSRHSFPNPIKDRARYDKWIHAVSNPKLVNMEPLRVHRSYRVCRQHFTIDDKSTNLLLKKTAVPSQKLPIKEDCSSTLLKDLGISRSVDLTPKAKKLYTKSRNLTSTVLLYKRRNITLKQRLSAARNMLNITQNGLKNEAVTFCLQQLCRKRTKPKGQRYTAEEKLMCLGLYKISGSAYRFLSKMFYLPSKRTMLRILENIPVRTGINAFLLSNLEKCVIKMKRKEKLCSVIFDEMSLLPHLEYNSIQDEIVGFKDTEIVDHVLVIMVKGILKNWKQTILFDFCRGATKPTILKTLITKTIEELSAIGLKVMTVICDQSSVNRSAIEGLVGDARQYYLSNNIQPRRRIIVNNQEIIPLYDVPHLLKGIRNNLLERDLVWEKQKTLTAKWDDIRTAYEIDVRSGDIRCLPRISEQHVKKDKIKKMKVCYATQVFSYSMAATISIMARNNETDVTNCYSMRKEASETAEVLKYFDCLYDSLNSSANRKVLWKVYTGPVTKNSPHIRFWREGIIELQRMYFRKEGTIKKVIPPPLKNFVNTVNGFIDLTEILFSQNINMYYTRLLNQDCVENLFGQIRQHRGRLTNLSANQFVQSYKTMLIRNIISHAPASNCEEGNETSLLQMRDFLHKNVLRSTEHVLYEPLYIHKYIKKIINNSVNNSAKKQLLAYIEQKIRLHIKCKLCGMHIWKTRSENTREYYQSHFLSCVTQIYNISQYILITYPFMKNIRNMINKYAKHHVIFSFICEHKNETVELINNPIIQFCIFNFCKKINHVMSGKLVLNRTNIKSPILKQAIDIHNKRFK